jgi:hypothetical protein
VNSRKRFISTLVGDEIEEKREKERIIQMALIILTTDKSWRKKESQGQEEFEAGAPDASEKYSNISLVEHIFKQNLIPIVFEPMPVKFYIVETSVYHITYCRFLGSA